MDTIFIRGMHATTWIGVYEWEQHTAQPIELDLDVGLPHSQAAQTDDVNDTIHYGLLVERLRELLAEKHFLLIEALAERIARLVREEFGAPWVKVAVTKLGILPGVKRVGVMIERGHRPR